MSEDSACPLCGQAAMRHLSCVRGVDFGQCDHCGLVQRDPAQWPDARSERAYYQLHRNQPDDPGYRRFLQPLFDALQPRLPAAAQGLDFGCGEGPALAEMLREAGHEVALYDPLFQPDSRCLDRRYDFVTASEVFEHLHRPPETLLQLDRLLRPGGWLGIMTGTPPAATEDLAHWHYLRDPTHVLFYPHRTMAWIAKHRGWHVEMPAHNVTLFHKPRG
ncbi:class I SAM-dependent methyltransferase [Algiphilus sp. NNCM1]|nr:class I SAM-dependent methyltransferase [Algiphilus acroporae]MCI5064082.1 class I SAM-dependent methyltransferase [Algiphilus sp.]MCI5103185.1 class I SAM-dependent methyltransferase [Algiphilus sp.]